MIKILPKEDVLFSPSRMRMSFNKLLNKYYLDYEKLQFI